MLIAENKYINMKITIVKDPLKGCWVINFREYGFGTVIQYR